MANKRKTKGYGSIASRGKDRNGRGIWLIRLDLGNDPVTGERMRPHRLIHGSKAEARRALSEWSLEVDSGIKADAQDVTLKQYSDMWHDGRVAMAAVRESTLERDSQVLRDICGYIGNVPLPDIDSMTVKRLYSEMRKDGKSANAVHYAHLKLKQVLRSAVNDSIIIRNPCDRVSVPRPKQADKRQPLKPEAASRLLAIIDDAGGTDAHIVGVRLGLATGMRLGEVLGLTWEHVDTEAGIIEVVQQHTARGASAPKTEAGIRTVAIDTATASHLAKWRKEQEQQLSRLWVCKDGTLDLKGWEDFKRRRGASLPVVSSERGGYIDTNNYRHWFQNFCVLHGFATWTDGDGNEVNPTKHNQDGTRADGNGRDKDGKPYSRKNKKPKKTKHYKGLRFHELRHTQATLLLAGGMDIKTVQARLGHASASITLDMYAHAMPGKDREAAAMMGDILSAGKKEPAKVEALAV